MSVVEDLTGRQIGPYQIAASLGKGGMGCVYRAYDPSAARVVAMKILPRQLALDPEFAGRFRQEVLVISRLSHPHILPLLDYGQADGYSYMVMPFVETGTLAHHLQGGPLPIEVIRRAVTQIGGALDHAHTLGVVHRDVKPPNVLVDAHGNYLLTDFGVAKLVTGSVKLTKIGLAVGTPTYMSPEQGLGQKVDGRSDLYALGVMVYQMATGRVPFKADKPMAVMLMHIQSPLMPPRALNPDLPEEVERVIITSLAKQPDHRYTTAAEMVRAFHEATARG
ncbi:MAG TPA: serine/threonine-protein kinase [Anaerolineae bacterium]